MIRYYHYAYIYYTFTIVPALMILRKWVRNAAKMHFKHTFVNDFDYANYVC